MPETIITKRCPRCKVIKPISEFHKNRSTNDELQSQCKICAYAATKCYRKTDKGKAGFKAAKKRYQQSQPGKATRKRYEQSPHGNVARKARTATCNAITADKLPRPDILSCKYCPKQAEQYHHPDYSKPLDVEPVCRKCHDKIHNIKIHSKR